MRYLDCNTADTWKQLPEYNAAHNYNAFKEAVRKLYPGSRLGSKWSISNLDKLIGKTARIGLVTLEDIARYYRSFFNISEYLVGQGVIAHSGQSQMFIRVFRADQLEHILNHLSIAIPNQPANIPYSLDDIHKAIDFIFDGPTHYFQHFPILPSIMRYPHLCYILLMCLMLCLQRQCLRLPQRQVLQRSRRRISAHCSSA